MKLNRSFATIVLDENQQEEYLSRCSRRLIVLGLGLILTLWCRSALGQYVVNVGPPSGEDDTAVLQAALDNCMTNHPTGCTIQLSAGTYESQQLLAENFHGSLQGMGMDTTIIQVLAPLAVTVSTQNVGDIPPSRTNKYPFLLIFLAGDITMSDMTFKVSDPNPATAWCYGDHNCGQTWLKGLAGVLGSTVNPANLLVERVGFEGGPGFSQTGRNFDNGTFFIGSVWPGAGPLTGTFKLISSRVSSGENGFEVFSVLNAGITIGGSPSEGNVIENGGLGGLIIDLDNSTFEYSHNNVGVASSFAGLLAYQAAFSIPQQPSQFLIQHNTFNVTGDFVSGIFFVDFGPLENVGKKADLVITHNTIKLAGGSNFPATPGIEAAWTQSATISNNRISGSALVGIEVDGGYQCLLKANNVQQLQALLVPVALFGLKDGDPLDTSYCTVVGGGNNKVNVYDGGTNDVLVGVNNMQGNSPGPAIKAAMQRKQDLIKSLMPH